MSTEVLIVGAGPTGLFAVFQCGMLNMRSHVVDSLPYVGGQCMALYPEKPIYDIPAFSKIDGASLIENLRTQAEPFQPVFHLDQTLHKMESMGDDGFIATTTKGTKIKARAILIAGGAGAYVPNRPALADLAFYEGKGIHYSVTSKEVFRHKKATVVGGGDSALDWAIALSDVASDVTLVHRRLGFTAAPATVTKLHELVQQNKIRLEAPAQITAVHGDEQSVRSVTIKASSIEKTVCTDHLLFFLGSVSSLGPIASWGLELEGARIKVDPGTQQTSRRGIFAIGDIVVYPNKLKLILCGFSEAAMAAHAIHGFLYPDTVLVHKHSTSIGIPAVPLT